MLQSVKNQVVVITGAASGYGRATAKRFREEGAAVIITDIDEKALREAADEIGAEAYHQNVTRWDDWQALFASVMAVHGRVDILVNNAGGGVVIADTVDQTLEAVDKIIALNLNSVVYGSMIFGKQMRAQGRGTDHQHLLHLRHGGLAEVQCLRCRQVGRGQPFQGDVHGAAAVRRARHRGDPGRGRHELLEERRSR